jgi:hypothetical protein
VLYLDPPFYLIRGVSVFRDHDDPLQYYFLPAMPKLSTTLDPTTGENIPQIQLLKFTGEAGSGGFFSFAVNLGIDDKVLDDVRAELKSLGHLDETPRLAPVILEDGRVRLMILGKKTAEAPPPGGTSPPPPPEPLALADMPDFVLKIEHYAKPSLYGDNQAIFSVLLDRYGTVLIEESLKGQLMPVGIIYSLDFFALRPAFSFRVTAEWDRVQKHFEEMSKTQVLFFSSEVDKVVDKLVESQVIKIEIDNFIPEGEDSARFVGHQEQMLNYVKDQVLDTFFQPSLNPPKSGPSDLDQAGETANRISMMLATGGMAGMASYTHKKVDVTRIDKKRFNFTMTERTTVRRSIYPQALLQGLSNVLRDAAGNVRLGDFVREINIDDPFFKRRKVTVTNRADLVQDSIQSVNVSLRYGGEPKNILLDATTPRGDVSWASILQNGKMMWDVGYSYKVTFKGADTTDRPAVLESAEAVFSREELEISPRGDNLYHIIPVPITTLGFPWDTYPHIEVQLRYEDKPNRITLNDTIVLNKDSPEATWPFFLRDRAKDTFQYKVIYRAKDNRDWTEDWRSNEQQQVLLRDPRPGKSRTLSVVPAVSWEVVSMIFVDIAYRDEANRIGVEDSFVFENTAEGKAAKTFSVILADPGKRAVNYRVKLLLKDNSLVELPPSMTFDNQIILRADMRGHRVVTVQPEPIDFAARNVDRVQLDVAYKDDANGLSYANTFTFRDSTEKGFFEYDYVDVQKRGYSVQVTTVFRDGFSVTKLPETVDRDLLVIKV